MKEEKLIVGDDIYYQGILDDIKKSKNPFQPIYEGFINALESLKLPSSTSLIGSIKIKLFLNRELINGTFKFDRAVIEDNGAGFDEDNYDRMKKYKDNRKGFANRGVGRIQFLHFFRTSNYVSIFKDGDGFKQRSFTLSKRYIKIKKNAIISHSLPELKVVEANSPKTVLTLKGLLDKNDMPTYNKITAQELKEKLISRYMLEFCTHRNSLPEIQILHYIDGNLINTVSICPEDIPNKDKEREIFVSYLKLSDDGKDFIKTDKQEQFKLTAFKIAKHDLKKNEIKLTSKNEIVDDIIIKLENLSPNDCIEDNRYLFLISGDYIDKYDTRGVPDISTRDDFKKENAETQHMFKTESICLDDIQEKANETILILYDEIREKKEAKILEIKKLKSMFLLNEDTIKKLSFGLDETEEKILERIYSADAKPIAKKDAEIHECIERLNALDPTSDNYKKELDNITSKLVRTIPMQNRTALTQYIARRKLVLNLFGKILDCELKIQQSGKRNIDERLLHNVIFQQSSDNPDQSDLWLINEDFIYFKGKSEVRLCDIEIDGRKMFKEKFSTEVEKYLNSLGENRKIKKPDILLFPEEGKCIIIEFKNPNVNVSDHLNQINKYAFWIRNYSIEDFNIETFYGYLIGESIEPNDVRSADSDFLYAYHFNYFFRPNKNVVGLDRRDGSLYSEVIKYSTLLSRALKRNEIFIKKLTENP